MGNALSKSCWLSMLGPYDTFWLLLRYMASIKHLHAYLTQLIATFIIILRFCYDGTPWSPHLTDGKPLNVTLPGTEKHRGTCACVRSRVRVRMCARMWVINTNKVFMVTVAILQVWPRIPRHNFEVQAIS